MERDQLVAPGIIYGTGSFMTSTSTRLLMTTLAILLMQLHVQQDVGLKTSTSGTMDPLRRVTLMELATT